jgi:cobalt-zinc-cadmium efflux system protein
LRPDHLPSFKVKIRGLFNEYERFMEYSHTNKNDLNFGYAFKIGITINILFVAIEALSGFLSNSMALLADAGHNLMDVLTLSFAWVAILLSRRKPSLKFTYGFRRSTILIAILNTILLLIAVAFIIHETITRQNHPTDINAKNIMIVASIGLLVNGFTAWLFMKGKTNDINIRSAIVHFIADALVSLGVVITGIIIAVTGIQWIDSLISFAIIAVIMYSSYKLLIDSVNLALDAVPENIDIEDVGRFLKELPEVSGVHDLHIWALSTTDAALTVHLSTNEQTDISFINSIQNQLKQQFNIEHATIQVEFSKNEDSK